VEAEARNFLAGRLAGLEQRVLRRYVDLFAVDDELGHAACPPGAEHRAVFHNCPAAPLSQPNARSVDPCSARCSSRSIASTRVGKWPAGTHHMTKCGPSNTSNHSWRRP